MKIQLISQESHSPTEEDTMFAVGHVALGYLKGKAASKLLDVKINVPLLFLVSLLPDIDFLLGLEHREPTHSIIIQTMVFIPILLSARFNRIWIDRLWKKL